MSTQVRRQREQSSHGQCSSLFVPWWSIWPSAFSIAIRIFSEVCILSLVGDNLFIYLVVHILYIGITVVIHILLLFNCVFPAIYLLTPSCRPYDLQSGTTIL